MNGIILGAMLSVTIMLSAPFAFADVSTFQDRLKHDVNVGLAPMGSDQENALAWNVQEIEEYHLVKVRGTDNTILGNFFHTNGFSLDVGDRPCVIIYEFFDSGRADAIRLVCV